ncbi:MAG TPA: hypothetical protein VMW25_01925 [Clostridia bacterium]|nr:hypothetical protein [Clostridia bacterium]
MPWSPEINTEVSEFQRLQQKVDELPLGGSLIDEQRRLIKERNDLIESDPNLEKRIFPVVDKRLEEAVAKITESSDHFQAISDARDSLVQTRKIEKGVTDSIMCRPYWSDGKYGGLITYYFARALDRLEVEIAIKEGLSVPPEILQIVTPASWEWKIPSDLDQRLKNVRPGTADTGDITQALKEAMGTEKSTYEIFVNAEHLQQGITTDFENWPPEWFKESTSEQQMGIRARKRLSNAAFIKKRVANVNLEQAKENQFLSEGLTKEEAEALWKTPGLEEALSFYMEGLFEGEWVPSNDGESATYCIRLKKKLNKDIEEKLFQKSEKKPDKTGAGILGDLSKFNMFRKMLRESVGGEIKLRKSVEEEVERKNIPLENSLGIVARAADAAAWNLISAFNTVESADINRKVGASPAFGEQIRANMHPLAKARFKILKRGKSAGTEEGWGGLLGTWLAERATNDPQLKRKFENGEFRPFPETMMMSLWELTKTGEEVETGIVYLGKRIKAKKNLAYYLVPPANDLEREEWKKEEINWNDSDIPADLFGAYLDTWDAAFRGYNIATGKTLIERFKARELQEWAGALGDVIGKLKATPLKDEYDSDEFIVWCLAASLGLKSRGSDFILALPPGIYHDIFFRAVLTPRLVSQERAKKITRRLNGSLVFGGVTRRMAGLRRTFRR